MLEQKTAAVAQARAARAGWCALACKAWWPRAGERGGGRVSPLTGQTTHAAQVGDRAALEREYASTQARLRELRSARDQTLGALRTIQDTVGRAILGWLVQLYPAMSVCTRAALPV